MNRIAPTLPRIHAYRLAGFLLAMTATALAFGPLTPDALVQNAAKHHEKVVTATGTVDDFKQKTSKKGNKYFLFKLKGAKESVNVYSQGEMKPALKKGEKVEVKGVFRKEKKVLDFTVKNEIDVTKGDGAANGHGVKRLK